jgi:hypothetical protein
MNDTSKNTENTSGGSNGDIPRKFNISGGEDLPDNPQDKEKLKSDTAIIDLPDVEDIPGQENVRPAPMGEMADTTIASDDEEGVGLLNDEEDDDLTTGTNNNVSNEEKKVLQEADEDMPTRDEGNLRRATMDNVDEDGTPLNEGGFGDATGEDISGGDLDTAVADEDNAYQEALGQGDEENNQYSTPDNDDNSNENNA